MAFFRLNSHPDLWGNHSLHHPFLTWDNALIMNGDLVEFPTEEVEYDPREIEALIGTEKSRKRNRLDSRKD